MENIIYKYIDIKLVEPQISESDAGLPIIHMGMTDSGKDRDGDTINSQGWDFSTFMGDAAKGQGANPVVLWSHNAHLGEARPAVGKVEQIYQKDDMWVAKVLFDDQDEFAMQLYSKYKRGFLRASSVGFLPTEYKWHTDEDGYIEGIDFQKQQLLELSLVNVPANPRALIAAGAKGLKDGRQELIEKFLNKQQETKEEGMELEKMKEFFDSLQQKLEAIEERLPEKKEEKVPISEEKSSIELFVEDIANKFNELEKKMNAMEEKINSSEQKGVDEDEIPDDEALDIIKQAVEIYKNERLETGRKLLKEQFALILPKDKKEE